MNIFYRVFFRVKKKLDNERVNLLKKNFRFCGKNVFIDPTVSFIGPLKPNVEIGDNSSISCFTTIYTAYGVKIGDNCLISSNCGISSYNHVQNSFNRRKDVDKDKYFSKPVVIGNNVWIGMNACILPGVKIGDNSIIGSGSVVTKNIQANEVWVGNPAKFIKKINFNIINN